MRKNLGSAVHGIVARLLVAGILLLSASAFAQHTYYISRSLGSNAYTSSQAQSKSAPWASLPGMASCTANCGSYSPVPGDQFILYGGDTWGASDLGINWNWSGSSANCVLPYGSGATSSCIYVGVDTTWYSSSVCGASFCRPIFSCGGAVCSGGTNNNYLWVMNQQYLVFDNIEMTGLYNTATDTNESTYIDVGSTYVEIKNCYFHGWSNSTSASYDPNVVLGAIGSSALTGTIFDHNVIDGSDTAKDSAVGISEFEQIYDNEFNYLASAILGNFNIAHDNIAENMITSTFGDHCNEIFNFSPLSGNYLFIYNNIIRHTNACPGVNLWFNGNASGASPSLVGYGFNNVMYDLNPGNILDIGNHPSVNYGTYYWFNNTVECGNDSSTTTCQATPSGPTFTLYSTNNHWITSGAVCSEGSATCVETTDLVQTVSTANGQGYNDTTETFVFSPVSGTGGTVGAGTNEQSLCTTIAALNSAAGTACQSSTTYACSYNTSNHTLTCPGDTTAARPSSAAWDIGAYQFQSTVQPPTNVTATAH